MQLDAVLERPQSPVCRVESCRVVTPDVAALGQRLERDHRCRRAQLIIRAAVHQLQQLDAELHIAQPARTKFELTSGLVSRHVSFHSPSHRLHVFDEVLARGGLPDHRLDGIQVGLPDLDVAR